MQAAGASSIWHGTCYCAPCKRPLVFLPNSGSAFPFLLSFPLNWCKRPVRRKNQDNRKETGKKTSLSPSPPLWQTLNITAVILNLLFSGTVYDFRPNVEIFKWVYFVNIWSFATERDRTRSWQRFPLPLFLRETEQPSTCTIQQQLNTALTSNISFLRSNDGTITNTCRWIKRNSLRRTLSQRKESQ